MAKALDFDKLFNFEKEEDIYLLGLLWADGNLDKIKNRISIEFLTSDYENIALLFNNWNIYHRQRKIKNQ